MPHTKFNAMLNLRLLLVQQDGLKDRVAHRLKFARMDLSVPRRFRLRLLSVPPALQITDTARKSMPRPGISDTISCLLPRPHLQNARPSFHLVSHASAKFYGFPYSHPTGRIPGSLSSDEVSRKNRDFPVSYSDSASFKRAVHFSWDSFWESALLLPALQA